jgi:hypothetical protein
MKTSTLLLIGAGVGLLALRGKTAAPTQSSVEWSPSDILATPVGKTAVQNIEQTYGKPFADTLTKAIATEKTAGDVLTSLKKSSTAVTPTIAPAVSPPPQTTATAPIIPPTPKTVAFASDAPLTTAQATKVGILTSPVGTAALTNIASAYGDRFASSLAVDIVTTPTAGELLQKMTTYPVSSTTAGTGHYDASQGGFVDNTGRVWPTNNPSFVPKGYTVV